jgi:hypothetical protein
VPVGFGVGAVFGIVGAGGSIVAGGAIALVSGCSFGVASGCSVGIGAPYGCTMLPPPPSFSFGHANVSDVAATVVANTNMRARDMRVVASGTISSESIATPQNGQALSPART